MARLATSNFSKVIQRLAFDRHSTLSLGLKYTAKTTNNDYTLQRRTLGTPEGGYQLLVGTNELVGIWVGPKLKRVGNAFAAETS